MAISTRLVRRFIGAKLSSGLGPKCNYGVSTSRNLGIGADLSLVATNNGPYLQLQSSTWPQPLLLHSTWLRDHCRCPKCYNEFTKNKLVNISEAGLEIRPKSSEVVANRLHITWPDGHKSDYNVEWLWENTYTGYKDNCRPKKLLWGGTIDSVTVMDTQVKYEDYMNSEDAFAKVMKSLVERGFAKIDKVPQTVEDTQRVAERICPLRLGFFGKIMEFSSDMLHRTQGPRLKKNIPHTDQSYLTEPAGIKVVNCMENLDNQLLLSLVDGFFIADQLKKMDEDSYRALSELPLLYEYTDDAFHHRCYDTVLKHDSLTGGLLQIKYNMYYRSSVSAVPFQDMDRLYAALHLFSQLAQNCHQFYRIQPTPGTVLLIDNWRLLFSTSNSANSKLAGCYLGWSDFMSQARTLGVVP